MRGLVGSEASEVSAGSEGLEGSEDSEDSLEGSVEASAVGFRVDLDRGWLQGLELDC